MEFYESWKIGVTTEDLTDGVNGGSARPGPRIMVDGVVESGLTHLDGSQTDPEAHTEQPGHDRTHLPRTSRAPINLKAILFPRHPQRNPFCIPEIMYTYKFIWTRALWCLSLVMTLEVVSGLSGLPWLVPETQRCEGGAVPGGFFHAAEISHDRLIHFNSRAVLLPQNKT